MGPSVPDLKHKTAGRPHELCATWGSNREFPAGLGEEPGQPKIRLDHSEINMVVWGPAGQLIDL